MFIGGSILGVGALGAYRAWFQVANLLNLPFHALTQVHAATTSRLLKEEGTTNAVTYLRDSTLFVFSCVFTVGLVMLFMTDMLAHFLGF